MIPPLHIALHAHHPKSNLRLSLCNLTPFPLYYLLPSADHHTAVCAYELLFVSLILLNPLTFFTQPNPLPSDCCQSALSTACILRDKRAIRRSAELGWRFRLGSHQQTPVSWVFVRNKDCSEGKRANQKNKLKREPHGALFAFCFFRKQRQKVVTLPTFLFSFSFQCLRNSQP